MNSVILGAGITGLSAGVISGCQIYEASDFAGGICSSYYVKPGAKDRLFDRSNNEEDYRFEIGGGHWIFGGDLLLNEFLKSFVNLKIYSRVSSVFFSEESRYIPYPLQNHLAYFDKELASKVINEILNSEKGNPDTMDKWLNQRFGKTLYDLFFSPFHGLYTAGLFKNIAPQDSFKTPVDLELLIKGAFSKTTDIGYNTSFSYPERGLNYLIKQMAEKCTIHYKKTVTHFDTEKKKLFFSDGTDIHYDKILSTLPLSTICKMADLKLKERTDPHSSVLVLNIGAKRGNNCPADHWLYIPKSKSGFHRVGFYSNVDTSFLPLSSRGKNDRVSIYVEKAFRQNGVPSVKEIEKYKKSVEHELFDWGFIKEIEVNDDTFVDVAYTWNWANNNWREEAIKELSGKNIYQCGRYGKWAFQGIAQSIKEGLLNAALLNFMDDSK